MEQYCLTSDTQIVLTEAGGNHRETFVIDLVLGSGATCHVYDAHYKDARGREHRVRLKECCPRQQICGREESGVLWRDASARETSEKAFEAAYDRQLSLQNNKITANVTAHLIGGLWEGENTLYAVLDAENGRSWDQMTDSSLAEILTTTAALAHAIGAYHKAGYLHLDIKPENVLILADSRDQVKLFDVDTVMRRENLTSGAVQKLGYSAKWAAPELTAGKLNRLNEKTDVFSIGAVLFSRILGRSPDSEDLSCFASWTFAGSCFDGVNPAMTHDLSEIFHHTIAANPQRRYESAEELEQALKSLARLAMEPVYLETRLPAADKLIGRTEELTKIRSIFDDGAHAVFLSGLEGVGKTALALQYAAAQLGPDGEYDCAVFCNYQHAGSIRQCISEIPLKNCECEDKKSRYETVKKLLNPRTLVVIDCFNVDLDADPDFTLLETLEAKFLVTTSTDFQMLTNGSVRQMTVEEPDTDTLKMLFAENCGWQADKEEEPVLRRIFARIGNNALMTVLLARELEASGDSLEQLENDLFGQSETVAYRTDGVVSFETPQEILHRVFCFAKLDQEQKQVLSCLYLLRGIDMSKSDFREWTAAKNLNVLNTMIRRRWIEFDPAGKTVSLHPLIEELAGRETAPSYENCGKLLDRTLRRNMVYDPDEGCWSVEPQVFLRVSQFLQDQSKNEKLGVFSSVCYYRDFQEKLIKILASGTVGEFAECCFNPGYAPAMGLARWLQPQIIPLDPEWELTVQCFYLTCLNFLDDQYDYDAESREYRALIEERDRAFQQAEELIGIAYGNDRVQCWKAMDLICTLAQTPQMFATPGTAVVCAFYRRYYELCKNLLGLVSGGSDAARAEYAAMGIDDALLMYRMASVVKLSRPENQNLTFCSTIFLSEAERNASPELWQKLQCFTFPANCFEQTIG